MPNWLMDWQHYKDYRFRKTRRQICPGDLRKAAFPVAPFQDDPQPSGAQPPDGLLWNPKDAAIPPAACKRAGAILAEQPGLDGVFIARPGSAWRWQEDILTARARTAWCLGGWPPVEDAADFWLQASLAFDFRGITTEGKPVSAPGSLFLELGKDEPPAREVLADFCRDFYLSPWVAFVEPGGESERVKQAAGRVRGRIRSAGNSLYDRPAFRAEDFPKLWVPAVYLLVTDRAEDAHPAEGEFPPNALKTLLLVVEADEENLPTEVDPAWDLCLAFSTRGEGAARALALGKPWQGWVTGSDLSALLKVVDIRARAQHFRALRAFNAAVEPPGKKLSVVISTYRRAEALRGALQSVAEQTLPPEEYEVIVVNNDPRDETARATVSEFQKAGQAAHRYLECPIPGLSFARNSAIAEAQGEALCFLDDDAVAEKDWLEQIGQAFADHPGAGVIGGHIQLQYPSPRPAILVEGMERFWTHLITPFAQYSEVTQSNRFPYGANWCARRGVLAEIGGFRGQYGRKKSDFSGGEEIIAAGLARKLGYTVGIAPRTLVYHRPDPARYTFANLMRTVQAQYIINYRIRRDLYAVDSPAERHAVNESARLWQRVMNVVGPSAKNRKYFALTYYCMMLAQMRLLFERGGDTCARLFHKR